MRQAKSLESAKCYEMSSTLVRWHFEEGLPDALRALRPPLTPQEQRAR